MSRPDYQGSLGFEVVKLTLGNGAEIDMLRETGADDRVATLEERVLWDALVALQHRVQRSTKTCREAADLLALALPVTHALDLSETRQTLLDVMALLHSTRKANGAALAKVGVAS